MTITVGEASSGGLTFPAYSTIALDALYIKTLVGTSATANNSGFWTAVELTHTPLNWESPRLQAAADTTEQTIVDITDSGVLTQIVAPAVGSSGTMTIRITIDGTVSTYVSQTMAAAGRFIMGYFEHYDAVVTVANGIGLGGPTDPGYSITTEGVILPTPSQAISRSNIGIKFDTSLKVTIQGSVAITSNASENKGMAGYTLTIPKGL